MSFEAEKYREPWESDEHWQLRKEFLEMYGNDYEEDRLLCLAQMYSNVELLECSYPVNVMQHIKELSRKLEGCSRKRKMPVEFVKEQKNTDTDETCNLSSTFEGGKSKKKPNIQISLLGNIFKLNDKTKLEDEKTLSTNINFHRPTDSSASCNQHVLPMHWDTEDNNETIVASDTKGMDIISLAGSLSEEDITFLTEIGKAINLKLKLHPNLYIATVNTVLQKFACVPTYKVSHQQSLTMPTESYKSDFYIKKFLISSAVASSKKGARIESVRTGIENLNNLPNVIEKTNQYLFPKYTNDAIPAISQFLNELSNVVNKTENVPELHSSLHFKSFLEISKEKLLSRYFQDRFVILLYAQQEIQHPVKVLHESAAFSHVSISYSFGQDREKGEQQLITRANVMLDGEICGEGANLTKQDAKNAAAACALEFLKTFVYTIKVKDECEGFIVNRSQLIDASGASNAISNDSIGCKMLKMMGWTGGSIGKIGNSGILEPVKSDNSHRFREGLGFSDNMQNCNDFYSRAQALIQDYAISDTSNDLIFSSEFTKEERKVIHRIAIKYNLKNASKGGYGDNRHVVLSQRFTAEKLIRYLKDVGGSTFKYELTEPSPSS